MVVPMVSLIELSHAVDLLDEVAPRSVVDRALRSAGLRRSMLCQGPGFVPYALEAIMVEHVARALGDPLLGVRLSKSYDYGVYDAYARYVLSAKDLRSALERGARAFPMIHPGSEIVLRAKGTHLLVGRSSGLSSLVGIRHLDEAALPIIGQVVSHFLGPDWRPDWVEVVDRRRSHADALEDLFKVPVRPGAEIPAVAVRMSELAAPNPTPPGMRDVVIYKDLPSLMGLAPPETLAQAVRCVLTAQFGRGDLSEEGVAQQLSMGPRTLQRALSAEGTSFRKIRVQVLEARARMLLTDTDLDIAAIARALGYEEPNSFRRAFRAWTEQTPSAFRAARQRAPGKAFVPGASNRTAGGRIARQRAPDGCETSCNTKGESKE